MNRSEAWMVLALLALGTSVPRAQSRPPLAASRPARQGSHSQYLNYLQSSLTQQTQWAASQQDNQKLWAGVRQTANNFLLSEWRKGKLQGTRPEEAFYVKCDKSTMTQNDLDNGRLILLVGVALERPAEFVTIRINQRTAGHK